MLSSIFAHLEDVQRLCHLIFALPGNKSLIRINNLQRKKLVQTICYYTSDSLRKIWLVESIQSIHNSLWIWLDKCNICCRYCIYLFKFNVCLVTKPLGVFSAECFASVSEDELCEKCVIKHLLNSVFAWYHELSKPRVCVIMPQPSASADNTDLGFDNSWYYANFVTNDIIIGCASTVVWHKIKNISANKGAMLLKLGRDVAPYEIY